MKLNQWELACIEYALRDYMDKLKDSDRTDLISGSKSAYEKLVAFIKDCESKCDVGNYAYTTELKFDKKDSPMSKNTKTAVYELMVFFKDEDQPTETEYYEKKSDAEKRKEFILADKDSWFRAEDVEAIEISDEPQEREFV